MNFDASYRDTHLYLVTCELYFVLKLPPFELEMDGQESKRLYIKDLKCTGPPIYNKHVLV